jgi:hypothetical protein
VAKHAAVRSAFILLVVIAGTVGWATTARAEDPAANVTLLSPADGAEVVVSQALQKWSKLEWRVDFGAPPPFAVAVELETASDPGFTRDRTAFAFTCAAGAQSCPLSHTSQRAYPTGSRWYWRVRVGAVTSATWSFVATAPPDRDRDAVPDQRDNCPSLRNPRQEDMEGDGKGDACQPDRLRPRVQAYAGSARRGAAARFHFRVHDNRYVSIRATVRYRGYLALSGRMDRVPAPRWSHRRTWWTEKPVQRSWPAGLYTFCIVAVDGAGNRARSCAPYRIS